MSQLVVITPEELLTIVTEAVRREVGALVRESVKSKNIMTEREAAEYVGQSPNTLRQWRSDSRGPVYLKDRRGIRYDRKDLDTWLATNRTFTSETRHG